MSYCYTCFRVHEAGLEQRVQQVHPVTRVLLVFLEFRDQMGPQDQRALLDMVDYQDTLVKMGPREQKDTRERRERLAILE